MTRIVTPAHQIRPATVADHPRLLELDNLTYSPKVSPGEAMTADTDLFERRSVDNFLVAVHAGHVVGYTVLGHPTNLPSNAHVQQIQALAVDPEHAGQGIGRSLVQAAIRLAVKRQARKVSLRVLSTNPGARRLYEQAGFEVEGTLRQEFIIDGQPVDDLFMAMALTDAADQVQ